MLEGTQKFGGKGKGKPSEANHGNVTPDFDYPRDENGILYETKLDDRGQEIKIRPRIRGGFSISHARQTTTLSLAVLRRLRFPLDNEHGSERHVDESARTALAALGLAAGVLAREDVDLRSRCHLFAEDKPVWQLLERPGEVPAEFTLGSSDALDLFSDAVEIAKEAGLPWRGVISLSPSPELVQLVHLSQELGSDGRTDGN